MFIFQFHFFLQGIDPDLFARVFCTETDNNIFQFSDIARKRISKQTLFSFRDDQRGFDGMAFDEDGNIYATAGLGAYAGIYVFSPEGEQLAFIDVPENPTNCTFGGPSEPNTLYFTAQVITGNTKPMTMGLYRTKVKKKGHRLYP